jgi:hypothetical protein
MRVLVIFDRHWPARNVQRIRGEVKDSMRFSTVRRAWAIWKHSQRNGRACNPLPSGSPITISAGCNRLCGLPLRWRLALRVACGLLRDY